VFLLLVSYAGLPSAIADEQCDPKYKDIADDFKSKYEAAMETVASLKGQLETLQQDSEGQASKVQAELQGCVAEKDKLASGKQAEVDTARQSADSCKTDLQQARASLVKEKAAAAEASTCHSTLTKVKSELEGQASKAATEAKSCSNLLAQVQTELDQKKSVMSEASSCKASLETVRRDLDHHKSKLAEVAAKAEEMLLPPWLARRVDAGVAKAKQLYEEAAASEAAVAGLKYWDQAKEAAAPHVATAKEQWSKISSTVGLGKVMQEVHKVEAELQLYLATFMKSQPALSQYADPVIVQLLVYAIVASPFTMLATLLALSRSKGSSDKGADSKNGAAAEKKAFSDKRPGGKARSKKA